MWGDQQKSMPCGAMQLGLTSKGVAAEDKLVRDSIRDPEEEIKKRKRVIERLWGVWHRS